MNTADATKLSNEESKINDTLQVLRNAGWLLKENDDSGYAACLPALIFSLNIPTELHQICEALPDINKNIDRIDLLNTLANLGYIARPVTLRICDIDKRLLPCLFIPKKCDSKKKNTIVILQDNIGKEESNASEFSAFISHNEKIDSFDTDNKTLGTAYFFSKEEDLIDTNSSAIQSAAGYSWFRGLLDRFKGIFWQVFLLSVILGIISLAPPIFVMMVYDKVINAHSPETLQPLVVGIVLALITEWRLRKVRSQSLAWFSARLDNIVNNQIFEQLMLMPPIYTERAAVASQLSRLKAFETVRDFFTGPLFLALIELPFTLIILVAIAIIAGSVSLVPIAVATLYVILILCMYTRLKTAIKLASNASSNSQQMTVESFEKMHSLRASGMTSNWFRQFRDHSGKASLARFKANYIASIIETIAHGLFILAGVSTIMLGVEKIWDNSISTGALIACIILVWRVLAPFQTLCTSLPRFIQLQNAINQVNRLMTIKTERNLDNIKSQVGEIRGHLTFSKVGLRYTKDTDPVFAGLTFDARPGQLVAITGGNGSGKSTILKLVNGLYRPQVGTIRIDDIDIRQFDAIKLRQHIAYVPQSPHFFQGSIADNLRFSEPLASDEILESALKQVDVWEDVCALPDGINTIINTNHISLPTTIAYKLNLARAYIKDTKLMLFDELPYALLNSSAGEAFNNSILNWKHDRTILIITHREDYIKIADIAILLRNKDTPIVGTPDKIIKAINKSNDEL